MYTVGQDREFSCGAPDCDKKGVPLDKVKKPVVYFCDGDCKVKITSEKTIVYLFLTPLDH